MTTNEQPLFHLLTQFINWANGITLDEKNRVQHELILAQLARFYGNIVWNAVVLKERNSLYNSLIRVIRCTQRA
jgi:environmental stress-induced protein Ves